MNLFLHIGTEKTGSSFLQTCLALNREVLVSQKFYYPEAGNRESDMLAGRISPGNGKDLYLALVQDNDGQLKLLLENYKKKAQKAGCNKILLSNENLLEPISRLQIFNKLVKVCNELNINWSDTLLVLRDPVEQALSLYKHRAKNGKAALIEEWLENDYNLTTQLNDLLQNKNLQKVSLKFGPYSTRSEELQKLMFKDWLNLEIGLSSDKDRVNPSLKLSELMLLKSIRSINPSWVNPLYKILLKIPLEDKAHDSELENYYRQLIAQKLNKHADLWKQLNGLNASLNIKLPELQSQGLKIADTFSFSSLQIEAITRFLSTDKIKPPLILKLKSQILRNFYTIKKIFK